MTEGSVAEAFDQLEERGQAYVPAVPAHQPLFDGESLLGRGVATGWGRE